MTAKTSRERSPISLAYGTFPGPGSAPADDRVVVGLRDSLDFAGAPVLRERLLDVLRQPMNLLILDLSRVPAGDAAGLAVLLGAQRRAGTLGVTMCLVAPSIPAWELLRSTGLNRNFAIYQDLPGALAAQRRDPARGHRSRDLASAAARSGRAVAA